MYSIVSTAIVHGIESIPVSVEVDVSDGMPMFEMVGFLASEVREARERVRTALKNSGCLLPPKRITVSLSPADLRKSGAGFDLPIAVGILTALGLVDEKRMEGMLFVGEIGLKGDVQAVNGILPVVSDAYKRGCVSCMVPAANRREASLVGNMQIIGVHNLEEVIAYLNGQASSLEMDEAETGNGTDNIEEKQESVLDFSEINGQKFLKRACEVSVAGMHNLLMIGPPGSGKTMTAKRIPSILPPLRDEERMELSKIYSVSGMLLDHTKLPNKRPFRGPHHTISPQGLAGGGGYPKPGEISLAHSGVLFLDELPEFGRDTLEILRQPLEEKEVRLVRLSGTYRFPSDFLLIAAMNPCRCGYYPDMNRCRCTQKSITQYLNRISQPLLDRIDICVEAPRLDYEELVESEEKNECSAKIRERVLSAHQIQMERFVGTDIRFNSQIPSARMKEFCSLGKKQEAYMKQMYKKLELSARSYHKIIKVARTIADLAASETIELEHLNEAVCYRSLDRKFWER